MKMNQNAFYDEKLYQQSSESSLTPMTKKQSYLSNTSNFPQINITPLNTQINKNFENNKNNNDDFKFLEEQSNPLEPKESLTPLMSKSKFKKMNSPKMVSPKSVKNRKLTQMGSIMEESFREGGTVGVGDVRSSGRNQSGILPGRHRPKQLSLASDLNRSSKVKSKHGSIDDTPSHKNREIQTPKTPKSFSSLQANEITTDLIIPPDDKVPPNRLKTKLKEYWQRFKFYPTSPFKIKWDLFIILLALYNSILVPFQFSFPLDYLGENTIFSMSEYVVDAIFIFDVIINFRSVYFDSKNEEYVTDSKKIALNYIFKGRFWIDVAASLPIEGNINFHNTFLEFLQIMQDEDSSNSKNANFKLFSLFKLIRLLRLGRIITYLKMNQNLKFGMKFLQLLFMLVMILHWISCFWYYIVSIEGKWVPPKDIGSSTILDYSDNNWFNQYLLTFYYSILGLVGNELMPVTSLEIGMATLIIFLGSIVIGIIVGNFSSILSDISKKARQQNEELDNIAIVMTSLKVPENIQTRVLEFYDFKSSIKFVRNDNFYHLLNENLTKTIKLFQTEDAIRKMGLFDKRNINQIENFANIMKLQVYSPDDVIIKQGDIGDQFYLIIEGMAEVCSEKKDFLFFDLDETQDFFGLQKSSQLQINLEKSRLLKCMKSLQKTSKRIKNWNCGKGRKSSVVDSTGSQESLVNNQQHIEQIEHQKNFKIINELKEGDYFGEIAIMTNLKRTCSVYAIKSLICGVISRQDLLQMSKNNSQFKNRLLSRMTFYKDNFIKFIITMIRNAGPFRVIPNHIVKNIIYKLKERKYYQGSQIIKMNEISEKCYFVLRGKVGVYVFIGDMYDEDQVNSIEYYSLFCTLDPGSHFNLAHFILQKESIFLYQTDTDCDLLELSYEDYQKMSQRSEILQNINDSMIALYDDEGNKYDFGRMIYKSITEIIRSQKIKDNYLARREKRIEYEKSYGVKKVDTNGFAFLKAINENYGDDHESDVKSEYYQYVRRKFKRNVELFRKDHFHISQVEIFGCIEEINNRRIEKENERKIDQTIKTIQDNFYELSVIQNISEYTMLASYYVRYPQVQEMNDFYLKSVNDEKLEQRKKLEEEIIKTNDVQYSFDLRGDLVNQEDIQREQNVSISVNHSHQNLKLGINGPLVGMGQKVDETRHSIDGINKVILERNQEQQKLKQQIQQVVGNDNTQYRIIENQLDLDGKNKSVLQQYDVPNINGDSENEDQLEKLDTQEEQNIKLLNQLTQQAIFNAQTIERMKHQMQDTSNYFGMKVEELKDELKKHY